jgi:hypothetical protein
MWATLLHFISPAQSTYILSLTAKGGIVYLKKSSQIEFVSPYFDFEKIHEFQTFIDKAKKIPWIVLIDQGEEAFTGSVMPKMRGMAKKAWLKRLATQSNVDSPYFWSELQGASSSQSNMLRVLCYTLGNPSRLTAWLNILHSNQVRIRAAYSPIMLTETTLDILKLNSHKMKEGISVLITSHVNGLRQTVSVNGWTRFSRLAVHSFIDKEHWLEFFYQELSRLREYIISNGLLRDENIKVPVYTLLPSGLLDIETRKNRDDELKIQCRWIGHPEAASIFVLASVKHVRWGQLAPLHYLKRDISLRITKSLNILSVFIFAALLLFVVYNFLKFIQVEEDIDAARHLATSAATEYTAIAKTFPDTPLTRLQLADLSERWKEVSDIENDMSDLLRIAGQILEQEPKINIDSVTWSLEESSADGNAESKSQKKLPQDNLMKPVVPIEKLVLSGQVRGIASDDLRGMRDLLLQLKNRFNSYPGVSSKITKEPLDLSGTTSFSGSGQQQSNELNFTIQIWKRPIIKPQAK